MSSNWLITPSSVCISHPADPFIPYVRVPLDTQGCLFIGNDTVRSALSKATTNSCTSLLLRQVGSEVIRESTRLVESFGLSFNNQETTTLENVALLISVNDMHQSGDMCEIKLSGLEYIYAPINENRVDLYPHIFTAIYRGKTHESLPHTFTSLFQHMDEILSSGKDVFIHCNQGEHRSAAVSVLYVCWRAQKCGVPCDFPRAHHHVQYYRRVIKPYISDRTTLMTEFARLHSNETKYEGMCPRVI
jgi:hypothetical protein